MEPHLAARNPVVRAAFTPMHGEHRMELVAIKHGVRYINDSRAVTVNAAWWALGRMPPFRAHWLVGGLERGNQWAELLYPVWRRVKALYHIGTGPMPEDLDRLARLVPTVHGRFASLRDAVALAAGSAEAGDFVLFCPACPPEVRSGSPEDHGREFKRAVATL